MPTENIVATEPRNEIGEISAKYIGVVPNDRPDARPTINRPSNNISIDSVRRQKANSTPPIRNSSVQTNCESFLQILKKKNYSMW